MRLVLDLHLHSKYSRAVSSRMDLEGMAVWADKKGVDVLGTGDITHPVWLKELESKLEPDSSGVYKLRSKEYRARFVLAGEVASVYSQDGKGRRVHNLILAPSLNSVKKINSKLLSKGANLVSDGRPMLGLSSIELSELVFGANQQNMIVPCHVWTPWYSLYGSKSGFNSVKECFGKYADKIKAVETGLSSNPKMNWQVKDLKDRQLVSFSDAHSPEKIGREATVIKSDKKDFNYQDLKAVLEGDEESSWQIDHTIEFYPEEGKYHYSGHRKCKVRLDPENDKNKGVICPTCGKPLTLGVVHRVCELGGESPRVKKTFNENQVAFYQNLDDPKRSSYAMIVPLIEIISEVMQVGEKTKTATQEYEKIVDHFGTEFRVLFKADLKEIASLSGKKMAKAIEKVRKGEISVDPGYDGVFGVVSIWPENGAKIACDHKQMGLF